MKIIDRYILTSYLKTFASVFVILMFIFVLQTIWLYISELAGKDLDLEIIFKFLLYFSPKLIPLVLPLTILVASIMVFGSFAEKYEFAAMKSTGISLQRAMLSLMIFIFMLSGTAFLFANNVIPYAEYKSLNLRRNIAQLKPAIAVTEGQFSTIGDITIKVAKKTGDRGQFLRDVIIHKKHPTRTGNFTVIKAERGELGGAENSNTLSLKLFDGNYYDEILQRDVRKQERKPFAKSAFEEYTINIDLSDFNNVDLDEEQDISSHKMYKISELTYELDSLSQDFSQTIIRFAENLNYRSGFSHLNQNYQPDSTVQNPARTPLETFAPAEKLRITQLALDRVKQAKTGIVTKEVDYQNKRKRLNKYEIALHEKYVIGFSCIILFFVGAPLGAIIRKGGMGLPMVVAIVIFLAYHFIGIFAKNNAENAVMHPLLASWFSTLIMLPLSIWLTYRATTDQGIFNADVFVQPVVNFFKKVFGEKNALSEDENVFEDLSRDIPLPEGDWIWLKRQETDKLIDIVRNYKRYGYTTDYRAGALKILEERGVSQQELHDSGNLYNSEHDELIGLVKSTKRSFSWGTVFYVLNFLFLLMIAVTESMQLSEVLMWISVVGFLLALIAFYGSLIKAHLNVKRLNEIIHSKDSGILSAIIFGFPFYILFYSQIKQKLKEYGDFAGI